MTDWTKDQDAILREKWGKTDARDIGYEVGRSKNAVIGRAHRIGLDPIKRVSKRPREQRQPRMRRMRMRTLPAFASIVPDSLFAPTSLAVGILDRTSSQCSYIEGEDRLCCGHPVEPGTSWCAFHYRVVYRPIDQRQRARSPINHAAE